MVYLLALSILAHFATLVVFARYIQTRDREERRDRSHLLTRIQAPLEGVAQAIEPEDKEQFVSMYDEFRNGDE